MSLPGAACWSASAPLPSSPAISPTLSSSAGTWWLPPGSAPGTSACVHLGPRPPPAGAARRSRPGTAWSGWAASAGRQGTSRYREILGDLHAV